MLALPQGKTYRDESFVSDFNRRSPHPGYRVFAYDLKAPLNIQQRLPPVRAESFYRLYPSSIGMLGDIGSALLLALRLPDGQAWFQMGYIGFDGFPVWWHRPFTISRPLLQSYWDGNGNIWYNADHINFTRRIISKKTYRVIALSIANRIAANQEHSNRLEALKAAIRARSAHNRQLREQHKKNKLAAQLKADANHLARLNAWHQPQILANLQAACTSLQLKRFTAEATALDPWL